MRTILATLFLASVLIHAYEASYTDASGAKCHTFHVGSHELDMCHATLDENGER